MNTFGKLSISLLTVLGIVSVSCSKPIKPEPVPGPDPEIPVKSYSIGDVYDTCGLKGVVFYLSKEDGTSGYIVSLEEWDAQWSDIEKETGAIFMGVGEGLKNSNIIRTQPDWKIHYPAMRYVNMLNKGAVTTWVLPSLNELRFLGMAFCNEDEQIDNVKFEAFNKALIDAGGAPISLSDYWSSTEMSAGGAYSVYMQTPNGEPNYYKTEKGNTYKVRAVSVF